MNKKISILGSTGSIGTQTLEIVSANADIEVVGLAAGSNIKLLEEQIRKYKPKVACVFDKDKAAELRTKIADTDCKIFEGMDGLIEIATLSAADIVVTAVVGMIGIKPTIAAIKAGKDIALANKETLVCAGHIIIPLVKECNVRLLPVDSEHSAIFQCLQGNEKNKIDKILLTASGGPFRGYTKEQLKNVSLEDALKHPNWSMGHKITIDSSTMVNKALEVMEAHWLFDVSVDDIEVVVQPKSIIHSMVQYEDGAVIAQLGTPDMKLPIQYALYYPERRYLKGDRLDFSKLTDIQLEKPDMDVFDGLRLGTEAGRIGGSLPTVFNAADEAAVAMFLNKEISYMQITAKIKEAMDSHKLIKNPSVDDILEIQREVEELVRH